MKKIAIALLVFTFLIGIVGAVTVTAGESITITLLEDYEHYSIIGNTTEVDLEVEQDGLNVTITTNKYMKDDTFEIIFFNKDNEIIVNHYSSDSSGSSSSSCGNQTEYIEVDNYVDKIVYKDKEVEVEKDCQEKIFPWLLIVGGLGLIGLMTYLSVSSRIKKESQTIAEDLKKENEE